MRFTQLAAAILRWFDSVHFSLSQGDKEISCPEPMPVFVFHMIAAQSATVLSYERSALMKADHGVGRTNHLALRLFPKAEADRCIFSSVSLISEPVSE